MQLQYLFRISLMTCGCILTACSTQLLSSEKNNRPLSTQKQAQAVQDTGFISTQHEDLYKIMVAEIASKNAQYDIALSNLYTVAQTRQDPALAKRATDMALAANEMTWAEKSATLWLQLAPQAPEAFRALAAIAFENKQTDKALAYIGSMLDSIETVSDTHLQQLLMLLQHATSDEQSVEVMEKLLRKRSQDTGLLMVYAQLLTRTQDYTGAILQLEKLLAIIPDHDEAVELYVKLLSKQKRNQEAIDKLEALLAIYPQQHEWRLLYAHLLITEKQYEDAKAQLNTILQEEPDNQEVRFTLATLVLETENYAAGKTYLLDFIEYSKTNKQRELGYYLIGDAAVQYEQWQDALDWYKKISADDERYLKAQARIINIYARQKQWQTALAHVETIEANDSDMINNVLDWKVDILLSMERKQEALTAYAPYLANDPDNETLLYARGLLADQLDYLDIMERDFKHLIGLNPQHADALNALGYSLTINTERYQEAHDYIKRALEIKPTAYYILDSMGWVLFKMGKTEQAQAYLKHAFELNADPEIVSHYGEVLWVQGDKDGARKLWQDSLKAHPKHEILLETVQRLDP